jgi:integrase
LFRLGQQSTPPKVVRAPKFPKLAENNIRKGFLEDGQYRKLIEYCPELWFRSLVECGRTYGWRVSELLTMRVNQLDVAQRVIRLEPGTTKNREGREVLMTDAVCTLLSALAHGKSADDYVFTRANGNPVRDFRLTWKNACAHEGIIMKIGGWLTRSVFERYAIVSRSDMNDAILKLQESENRVEQERLQAEEQQAQIRAQIGHNKAVSPDIPASRAVN